MADEPRVQAGGALPRLLKSGLVVAALLCGLLIFIVPEPRARAYPQRTPVRFWHMWTGEWKDVICDVIRRPS